MRFDLLQQVLTRCILEEDFREKFFEDCAQVLNIDVLTEEEIAYFRAYTPEQLYAFVGGMAAHLLVPIHASRRVRILPDDYPDPQNGLIGIRLMAGTVFGNGIHPSTQLCLEALEDHLQAGDAVLDVGTGTGILAIAAAKMGAARVLAVDVLPESMREASTNLAMNGVQQIVRLAQGSFEHALPPNQRFGAQIVLANMLPPVLLKVIELGMLQTLDRGALLIMSGMRLTEYQPIEEALLKRGMRFTHHTRDEWISFRVRCGNPQ